MEKWRRIALRDRILLILVVVVFLIVNKVQAIFPLEAVFYLGGFVGIMLYIGYINTSIYDLKLRVKALEMVVKRGSESEVEEDSLE
ncbi:hypothetical protein [Fusibacter ferrireducens]|uniref:Uncharacterized protein n=1 Tax=Fusibacter ferrireducens TaxID=2785058 RepID=A0ABR9ZSJ2_9FIRM|nr:hypothetical protein [Fusibacter ferrireducens]MBF4693093.1 hypothetical protein [Fusibacter ferrireducens]